VLQSKIENSFVFIVVELQNISYCLTIVWYNRIRSTRNVPDIFSRILNNFGFHRQFSIQFSDIILQENPSIASRAETCGQPDKHYRLDEAYRRFFVSMHRT